MLQLKSAPSRSYLIATRANDPTGHADDASKSFPSPKHSYRINSLHLRWLATRDCYLATSVDQLGDAVVHQVRSRGRKAPAKRQVEPSAARKTHAASTGLALELISGFGTKLMQEHKTARMAQEQQSLASGALLGQLQFSVAARPASGGYRIMYTNLRLETDL